MHIYRDVDLVQRIGAATAVEVRATGVHYTFAPCVAVSFDKLMCSIVYLLLSIHLPLKRLCIDYLNEYVIWSLG